MTFDRQLDQVCPHMVAEEALFLSNDRVTVRPMRPISSFNSVRVRVDGTVEVPSHGYHLPAETLCRNTGPFDIQSGQNTLVVSVNGGPNQVLSLPIGNRIPIQQVVEHLNQQSGSIEFSISPKRRIKIRSGRKGKSSSLVIRSESTANQVLGLTTGRYWRGQTSFSGWSLIKDPSALEDRPLRLIVFDSPISGFRNYVEIDYATVRNECRRCGGLGYESDWRYTKNGDYVTVKDEELLRQEMVKMVFTVQGSNPFHPWYGTRIVASVGKKLSSSGILHNMITSDIYESFRRWQNIKTQQERDVGQEVSDEEFPFRLMDVRVDQNPQNPTVVFVSAVVQNRSNRPVTLERSLALPGTADLFELAG